MNRYGVENWGDIRIRNLPKDIRQNEIRTFCQPAEIDRLEIILHSAEKPYAIISFTDKKNVGMMLERDGCVLAKHCLKITTLGDTEESWESQKESVTRKIEKKPSDGLSSRSTSGKQMPILRCKLTGKSVSEIDEEDIVFDLAGTREDNGTLYRESTTIRKSRNEMEADTRRLDHSQNRFQLSHKDAGRNSSQSAVSTNPPPSWQRMPLLPTPVLAATGGNFNKVLQNPNLSADVSKQMNPSATKQQNVNRVDMPDTERKALLPPPYSSLVPPPGYIRPPTFQSMAPSPLANLCLPPPNFMTPPPKVIYVMPSPAFFPPQQMAPYNTVNGVHDSTWRGSNGEVPCPYGNFEKANHSRFEGQRSGQNSFKDYRDDSGDVSNGDDRWGPDRHLRRQQLNHNFNGVRPRQFGGDGQRYSDRNGGGEFDPHQGHSGEKCTSQQFIRTNQNSHGYRERLSGYHDYSSGDEHRQHGKNNFYRTHPHKVQSSQEENDAKPKHSHSNFVVNQQMRLGKALTGQENKNYSQFQQGDLNMEKVSDSKPKKQKHLVVVGKKPVDEKVRLIQDIIREDLFNSPAVKKAPNFLKATSAPHMDAIEGEGKKLTFFTGKSPELSVLEIQHKIKEDLLQCEAAKKSPAFLEVMTKCPIADKVGDLSVNDQLEEFFNYKMATMRENGVELKPADESGLAGSEKMKDVEMCDLKLSEIATEDKEPQPPLGYARIA